MVDYGERGIALLVVDFGAISVPTLRGFSTISSTKRWPTGFASLTGSFQLSDRRSGAMQCPDEHLRWQEFGVRHRCLYHGRPAYPLGPGPGRLLAAEESAGRDPVWVNTAQAVN